MEVFDSLELVDVFRRLPVGFVTDPFNQVLKSSPNNLGIEYLLNVPFLFAVYLDWWWGRNMLSRVRVFGSRVE